MRLNSHIYNYAWILHTIKCIHVILVFVKGRAQLSSVESSWLIVPRNYYYFHKSVLITMLMMQGGRIDGERRAEVKRKKLQNKNAKINKGFVLKKSQKKVVLQEYCIWTHATCHAGLWLWPWNKFACKEIKKCGGFEWLMYEMTKNVKWSKWYGI